ncbi:MAG: hypothetical protein GY950_23080, partial [bacterium]|nr:hypothetical protein [bacterium]
MALNIPNLDDIKFEQLVDESRAQINRCAPQWTDHNLHDPGITFIDLFAWLAEMQIYHLNRVTETNYKKFLELVGIHPLEARPAAVDVTFEKIGTQNREEIIHAGQQLITKTGTVSIVFTAIETLHLLPFSLHSVKTVVDSRVTDNTAANQKDRMYFPAFGENAPPGAELRLGFDSPISDKEIQLSVYLAPLENGEPAHQDFASTTLAWEYSDGDKWKPFTIKNDKTLAFNRNGTITFTGPPALKDREDIYWIRCRLTRGQYEIFPMIN